MTKTRRNSARKAKIGTAVFVAGLTAGAIAGPGFAQAQDYPPQDPPEGQPTTPTTSTSTSIEVAGPGPETPATPSGAQQAAGSLPATGNSDVAPSLMIAGGALLAGLAITGVATASRRRDDGTAPSPF